MEINKDIPIIKVIKITKNENGTMDLVYEPTKAFREYAKKEMRVKRLTNKRLNQFLTDLIMKGINEEDGYSIKKI